MPSQSLVSTSPVSTRRTQGRAKLYRAVYLTQRNLKDFVSRVAAKWNLDATKVVRTVHVLQRGLEVAMDDDVIRELSEGQDMKLEIAELDASGPPIKRDWEMALDAPGEPDPGAVPAGYELRLSF